DQPGGDVEALMALARELDIQDALDFTGFCTDAELIRAYQLCDIAVQPSIMEGFGLTALEAMRAGAPLIAARAGALPGVVGDGALLFDPYNAAELADHIERLIDDPSLARGLRERGRRQCHRFDWEVTAERVAKSFDGMVRPLPNRPRPISAQRAFSAAYTPTIDPAVVPTARLAAYMAAAEVNHARPGGRILFDVTSTYYNDYGTGIQRVVTRIARKLLDQYDNVQLVVCDSDVGLEAAYMDAKGRFRTEKTLSRELVYPQAGDTLILLDSSWIWYKSFETVMADARLRGATVISGLHDLVPISYPAYCDDGMPINFQKWLRAALRYSDAFICVSKATAEALHDLLSGTDFPRLMKIGHFRLGSDSLAGKQTDQGPHDPDHFLTVGTLEPRKGHSDIIAAFEQLWADGANLRLTFVGRPGWGTEGLQSDLKALAIREPRFQWISDADDRRLARAYAEAGTVIAASHAEGFGLPLVEGGRSGCGVIARDIPVFREVAPSGTRFFDGVDSLIEQILAARAEPTPPGETDPPISWAESAALLIDRIRAGDFAQSYRPLDADPFVPDTDTGHDRMKGPLDPDEVDVRLKAIPSRIDSPLPDHYRFVVRVENDGPEPLFSKGRLTGEDCIHLSYMTHDHDGHERQIEAGRTKIPFGLPRGQSTVLAIDLPDHLVENPNILVHFALVQEGRAWWPYLAELDRDAHNLPTTAG
ncbi:MAG: glycosyltransferase, partial [Pseudomonadota bacterium]